MAESLDIDLLEPRQLRYVLTVAQVQSFRGAAAVLSIPASMLSREIAEVERMTGAPLFERRPQAAIATAAGMEIARKARPILERQVARNEDLVAEGCSLRIGWVDYGRGQVIQRAALAEFRAQYPGIPVCLSRTPFRDQLREIAQGELNAGFYPGTRPELPAVSTEIFLADSIGLVMLPSGHRLANKDDLALGDLRGVPFHTLRMDYAPEIVTRLREGLQAGGWRGRQTTGSLHPSQVMTVVACGAAWSAAPSDLVGWTPPGIVLLPLSDGPLLGVDLHVLWNDDDPVASAFVRLAFELRDAIAAAVPRPAARDTAREGAPRFPVARTYAEQARAATELPDWLLQDIIGSELQLEAVRRRLPPSMSREIQDLERVVELLERAAHKGREELQNNLSRRKRAKQALPESECDSRLVVDHIPGLVALLTAAGELEFVNRQALEYFGQTPADLKKWRMTDVVHPEDLQHVIDVFTQSIASGTPYQIVQRFRRSDGVYRWFENRGVPVHDTTGRITRWCVLLTDIDQRKHAEGPEPREPPLRDTSVSVVRRHT